MRQRLLSRLETFNGPPRPRRRPNRHRHGVVLVEWLIASVLGIVLCGLAVMLLLAQAQWASTLVQRQWQSDDQAAVARMLRSEIRIAGHRQQAGPRASHDSLRIDETAGPSLTYRCDACGSGDSVLPASFRLQGGALAHRGLGATSHQPLHDPAVSAWSQWQIEQGQSADCIPWVQVVMRPASSSLVPEPIEIVLRPRPRNLGLLACE